jgi:hypothetical protein
MAKKKVKGGKTKVKVSDLKVTKSGSVAGGRINLNLKDP